MDKKGDAQAVLMTFCVVAVIILILDPFGQGQHIAKDTSSMATYIAIDTAYYINTLYASPGSVQAGYPFSIPELLKLEVNEDNVTVYRKGIREDGNKSSRLFGADKFVALRFEPVAGIVYITKNPGTLEFTATEKTSYKQLRCIENAPAKKIDASTIVIDAAYQDAVKAERTFSLTNYLKAAGISSMFSDTSFTRADNIEITLEERLEFIETDTSVVLSLEIGSESNLKNNYVKAYIPFNSDESQRLACTILNLMTDKIPEITGISIIPTASKEILNKNTGNTAILLEIGNINQPRQENMLHTNLNKISNSIKEGIKAHYEVS